MNQQPSKSSKDRKKNKGYQVWHFSLAVPALAIVLQLMLGSLTPLPQEYHPEPVRYASSYNDHNDNDNGDEQDRLNRLPKNEILPLNLRGEMTGPLLASVLKAYFPKSTTEHATDFRDTLPPCDNPRMIVILPKDDKPVF